MRKLNLEELAATKGIKKEALKSIKGGILPFPARKHKKLNNYRDY